LIPYDRSYLIYSLIKEKKRVSFAFIEHCAGAGLFLQSSNEQRSTQCTNLQQGHNYLSDTNSLYLNFYSRTPTVRGGFWIIYEGWIFIVSFLINKHFLLTLIKGSHPNAEVHLHCGSREKIGVPSWSTVSPNSVSPPPISTPFDHGWSRLAFNNPPNPTTPILDHMMHMRLSATTPSSPINTNHSKYHTF
jgi:hypothetical protein